MKKRIGLSVLLVLLCGMLFANGTQEKKAVDSTEPITLTIWHSFTQPERAAYIEEMARKYSAEHPNVKFEIEIYPWNTFDTKWKTAVSTGDLPDLSTALPEHVIMMEQTGCLAPMNDFANEMGNFLKQPLNIMTVNNKLLAVPFYAHSRVLWERTDIIEKYGLKEPTTMSELLAVAKEITDRGEIYGMAVPMKKTDFYATIYLYILSKTMGAHLITEEGKANLTSPEMIDAINYLVTMYKEASPKGSINYGDPETNDSFIQGKTAFYFESGFAIGRVKSGNPEIADSFKAIQITDDNSNRVGSFADYINFVVYDGKKEAIAKDFLKTLYDKENYYKFMHLVPGGMIPTIEGVIDSPEFLNNETIQEHIEDIKLIENGVKNGSPIGADFGLTPAMNIVKSMGIIEEMFQNIVLGNEDVMTAAKKAENKMNKEIESFLAN